MLMMMSPAKTFQKCIGESVLDLETLLFPEETRILLEVLGGYSKIELEKLMKISGKLSETNWERYQNFPGNKEVVHEAITYFYGEAYKGLDVGTLSGEAMTYAQEHLVILSGLYGILKPLDGIKPYRLEMGTKLPNHRGDNLYAFWRTLLTEAMLQRLEQTDGDKVLLNLASDEYSKALDLGKLQVDYQVLQLTFKVKKGETYKVMSMYAKKARGQMIRYILQNQINTLEALKQFTEDGYRWDQEHSTAQQWIFLKD